MPRTAMVVLPDYPHHIITRRPQQTVRLFKMGVICQAVQRGQLTRGDSFIERVSRTIEQKIEFRGQGRPKRG